MDSSQRPPRAARKPRTTQINRPPRTARTSSRAHQLLIRDLPVLPVVNTVVLPHMMVPLFIDQGPAIQAVEAALKEESRLLVVAQRSADSSNPTLDDLFSVGTECQVNRVLRMPDGNLSVLIQGMRRIHISTWLQQSPFGRARGLAHEDVNAHDEETEGLARAALQLFETCSQLSDRFTEDMLLEAQSQATPGSLADFLIVRIDPPMLVRQELLETTDVNTRLRRTCELLTRELAILEIQQKVVAGGCLLSRDGLGMWGITTVRTRADSSTSSMLSTGTQLTWALMR